MKTIVVGYDGSDSARRALERAASLCQNGTTLEVIAVAHPMPQVKGAVTAIDPLEEEERRHDLDQAAAVLEQRGIEARMIEGRGDPARTIAERAKDAGADLIVVGTHGRGAMGRALLGSVSTNVLHRAPCDVLVVR